MTTPLKTESAMELPQELEALTALAGKDLISMRRLASFAYATGRLDGMLEFAKISTGAIEQAAELQVVA